MLEEIHLPRGSMDGKEAAVVTERPIEDRVAVQVGDDDNVDE